MMITLFGKAIKLGKNKTQKPLLKAFGKQLNFFVKEQPDLFTGQEKDGKKLLPSKADPQVRRWQADEKKDGNNLKDTKNMLDNSVKDGYIEGDKKRSSKMKRIKAKTPTGKEIEISYDDKNFIVTVPILGLTQTVSTLGIIGFGSPKLNLDKPVALDMKSAKEIGVFLKDIAKEKEERINKKIPGYSELKAAYKNRRVQIDIDREYMDRAMRTSIGSGNTGDVKGAEGKVKELEGKYPVAKHYISWVNSNPASASGFQAKQAAVALLNGISLDEANQIANDYEHYI